jgi:hypothetical protein
MEEENARLRARVAELERENTRLVSTIDMLGRDVERFKEYATETRQRLWELKLTKNDALKEVLYNMGMSMQTVESILARVNK